MIVPEGWEEFAALRARLAEAVPLKVHNEAGLQIEYALFGIVVETYRSAAQELTRWPSDSRILQEFKQGFNNANKEREEMSPVCRAKHLLPHSLRLATYQRGNSCDNTCFSMLSGLNYCIIAHRETQLTWKITHMPSKLFQQEIHIVMFLLQRTRIRPVIAHNPQHVNAATVGQSRSHSALAISSLSCAAASTST